MRLAPFAALVGLACGCTDAAKPASGSAEPALVSAPVAIEEPDAPSHKNGIAQFKEPGVYLDGVPVGMLTFGELPVPLAPAWHQERGAVAFRPGDGAPRTRVVLQRRYRMIDYLTAIGVDVERIEELHIYGNQRRAAAVIVSGDDLRGFPDFTFRFGSGVTGKPIPACPVGLGDGKCPDSIGAVAIYVDKPAPTREGGSFYLDGKRLTDIPYYGQPLRGGIRVYRDGRLVSTIKRKLLDAGGQSVTTPDGQQHRGLMAFLRTQGVATDDVLEAWVIYDGRRVRRLGRADLDVATFVANPAHKGEILIGDGQVAAHSLALHTRAVTADQMPIILAHELQADL